MNNFANIDFHKVFKHAAKNSMWDFFKIAIAELYKRSDIKEYYKYFKKFSKNGTDIEEIYDYINTKFSENNERSFSGHENFNFLKNDKFNFFNYARNKNFSEYIAFIEKLFLNETLF